MNHQQRLKRYAHAAGVRKRAEDGSASAQERKALKREIATAFKDAKAAVTKAISSVQAAKSGEAVNRALSMLTSGDGAFNATEGTAALISMVERYTAAGDSNDE